MITDFQFNHLSCQLLAENGLTFVLRNYLQFSLRTLYYPIKRLKNQLGGLWDTTNLKCHRIERVRIAKHTQKGEFGKSGDNLQTYNQPFGSAS